MRLLHTMLRVGDLQRSIDFYTKVMGMQLLRTSENTEYKFSVDRGSCATCRVVSSLVVAREQRCARSHDQAGGAFLGHALDVHQFICSEICKVIARADAASRHGIGSGFIHAFHVEQ